MGNEYGESSPYLSLALYTDPAYHQIGTQSRTGAIQVRQSAAKDGHCVLESFTVTMSVPLIPAGRKKFSKLRV